MYTDEPVLKKDVASGQNFSRFNLLTKITVFPFLGYPTADASQDSPARDRRLFSSKVYTGNRDSHSESGKEVSLDYTEDGKSVLR
jgi:hypothetical protein